jgi:glycosyltransferase involved in cell wall biosynthesis
VKFAFVTPRYGAEIAGGVEHACRLLAEHVATRHEVDVLTTCARDPQTWQNAYTEGSDRVRGVVVRRFPVAERHEGAAFAQLSDRLIAAPHSRGEELEWVRRLGPTTPGLLEFLKRQHRSYDALVFCSLEHATTVDGMRVAPERSILIPHVQLRPELRFGVWADLVSSAGAVGLLAGPERELLGRYIGATVQYEEVLGIGIDPPPQLAYPRHQQDPADAIAAMDEDGESEAADVVEPWYQAGRGLTFRRRHRLYGSFVLYGGRVERDNGCEEMLEYFGSYAGAGAAMPLVIMGAKMMHVSDQPHTRLAGVLPDRERMAAYEAADVTIAPSPDDLLAQATLESFAVGTPVLASARNGAAVEHCSRANAGLFYGNREEFVEALRLLVGTPSLRETLGENGRQYVRQHFRWEDVLGRFDRLVGRVRK